MRIVQGFILTGVGFGIYPFLRSFMPGFKQDLSLDVDVRDLQEGQGKVVHWLGRNITIVRRSKAVLEGIGLLDAELKDPDSLASHQPPFAENIYRSRQAEFFVAYNNCTHLGCEVVAGGKGFQCPCHQSDFDAAGRVFEYSPAPANLSVPHYRFIKAGIIRLQQAGTA